MRGYFYVAFFDQQVGTPIYFRVTYVYIASKVEAVAATRLMMCSTLQVLGGVCRPAVHQDDQRQAQRHSLASGWRYAPLYMFLCTKPRVKEVITLAPTPLAAATPGMHYPHSRFQIRRVRLAHESELLAPLVAAGYDVEDDACMCGMHVRVYGVCVWVAGASRGRWLRCGGRCMYVA